MNAYTTALARTWPDNFSLGNDALFQETIRPVLEHYMTQLKDFDRARDVYVKANLPADYKITYRFHDHSLRVANDARSLARHIGLSADTADNLYWATIGHDFYKALLPVDIWDMQGKPTDSMKAQRRSHAPLGAELLRQRFGFDHPFIDLAVDITRNHHEQMDGNGPLRVPGALLSAPVRLVCIVDSFDGYSIERPHFGDRDTSAQAVIARMRDEKGASCYDLGLLDAFADYKLSAPTPAPVIAANRQGMRQLSS